jgi:hypothetical protein
MSSDGMCDIIYILNEWLINHMVYGIYNICALFNFIILLFIIIQFKFTIGSFTLMIN